MPGFMVYFTDWDMPRQILNAETFKAFFDAVFCYARDGEIPEPFEDHTAQVFFNGFREKIDADIGKYQDKCRKASEAARKSHANASERQQTQADAANTNPNTKPNTNINNNPKTNNKSNDSFNNQFQTEHQDQEQYGGLRMQIEEQQMALRRESDDEELPF